MTTYQLDEIRTILQIVAFAVGSAFGVLWTIRTGFFQLNSRTMTTLKEAIAALEEKVAVLEAKIQEYDKRNKELEGMVEGKERIISEIITSITESGLCEKAWDCDERIVPVDHIKTRRTSGRITP